MHLEVLIKELFIKHGVCLLSWYLHRNCIHTVQVLYRWVFWQQVLNACYRRDSVFCICHRFLGYDCVLSIESNKAPPLQATWRDCRIRSFRLCTYTVQSFPYLLGHNPLRDSNEYPLSVLLSNLGQVVADDFS